jgi:hypothetical protein
MRKRFNRNALCSSDHYRESKKAHRAFLEEEHSNFIGMGVSEWKELHANEEELSLGRKMALQSMKKISTKEVSKTVFIKIAWTGKLVEITRDMYNQSFSHARKYDCHGNEIFD